MQRRDLGINLRMVVAVVGFSASYAHGQARIIEIADPRPGSAGLQFGDLNRDGTVAVGFSLVPGQGKAFRWTEDGGLEFFLDPLGGAAASTSAASVSADGSVIVGQFGSEGFRWSERDGIELLGFLWRGDGETSNAQGVSADGDIVVGASRDREDDPDARQAFRWTRDTGLVGIGFLPGREVSRASDTSANGSVIVGTSQGPGPGQGYIWTGGPDMQEIPLLPFNDQSRANAVSADGFFVVGISFGGPIGGRAFRWTKFGSVDLGELPGGSRSHEANDISDDGEVVVGSAQASRLGGERPVAFVWTQATRMLSVEDEITDCYGIDLAGRRLEHVRAVSGDGRVLAIEGKDASGDPAAYLVTLPVACRVDLDGDGDLTFFDFIAFQNAFAASDRAADFDCDGELTLFDFLAFQNAFDAGCP